MEKKLQIKKLAGGIVCSAALVCALGIAGCSSSNAADDQAADETATEEEAPAADEGAAAAPGEAAGFTEYPIFEDQQVEFLNVSAVYFQPVPMAPGFENVEGYDIHLECDISALENDLGYGVGDWVPYLTIDYTVATADGTVAAEGTFMEMSASDGPHYGANIALPDAGTYNVTFTIHSPEDMNYLIHSDAETGPGGVLSDYFANGPLTVTYEGWDYTPQEW